MAERFDIWAPSFRDRLGRFKRVSRDALINAAARAEERAQDLAPVKTGELRASIQGTVRATGTGKIAGGGSRIFLSAPRKYAPVEFGSRRGHRAQRFLERAMLRTLDELERDLADDLERTLIKGSIGHIGPRFSGVTRG